MEKSDRLKIQRICDLFGKADDLYNELSDELQHEIIKFHNDNASLPYCIRWGLQAASEIDLEL